MTYANTHTEKIKRKELSPLPVTCSCVCIHTGTCMVALFRWVVPHIIFADMIFLFLLLTSYESIRKKGPSCWRWASPSLVLFSYFPFLLHCPLCRGDFSRLILTPGRASFAGVGEWPKETVASHHHRRQKLTVPWVKFGGVTPVPFLMEVIPFLVLPHK